MHIFKSTLFALSFICLLSCCVEVPETSAANKYETQVQGKFHPNNLSPAASNARIQWKYEDPLVQAMSGFELLLDKMGYSPIIDHSVIPAPEPETPEPKTLDMTAAEFLDPDSPILQRHIPKNIDIPILLYHHFAETAENSMTVTESTFEKHMHLLSVEGFTAISFDELISYVKNGTSLPAKPVIITIDDGYQSNYDIAYPVLKKYNMKATIFPIGVTFGKDLYKDYAQPITPHFGKDEAQEMAASGLISLQSHTYDMHQVEGLDYAYSMRRSVLRKKGESISEYEELFTTDLWRSIMLLETTTGHKVNVFSYPYGENNDYTELWLGDMGFESSVVMGNFTSTVKKGNKRSLRRLGRHTMTENTSKSDLLEILESSTENSAAEE